MKIFEVSSRGTIRNTVKKSHYRHYPKFFGDFIFDKHKASEHNAIIVIIIIANAALKRGMGIATLADDRKHNKQDAAEEHRKLLA